MDESVGDKATNPGPRGGGVLGMSFMVHAAVAGEPTQRKLLGRALGQGDVSPQSSLIPVGGSTGKMSIFNVNGH